MFAHLIDSTATGWLSVNSFVHPSREGYSQVPRTARHSPSLLQTMFGVPVLLFTEHKILLCPVTTISQFQMPSGYTPLYSLQYAPMKKAPLFKGALVRPSSLIFGTWSGMGVGSTYSVVGTEPGWNVDILADGQTGWFIYCGNFWWTS